MFNMTNQAMKKIFYSIFALSTLMFTATSCSEDRGTTTEVADSNEDEYVNPNHIRGYDQVPGGKPGSANANRANSTPVGQSNDPVITSNPSNAMSTESPTSGNAAGGGNAGSGTSGGNATGGNASGNNTTGGNASGGGTSGSGSQTSEGSGNQSNGSGNQ